MTARAIKILADYLTGTPVSALAQKHSISEPRVYQLLDELLNHCGVPGGVTSVRFGLGPSPEEILRRLHDRQQRYATEVHYPPQAHTPEEFYRLELPAEQKTFNLGEHR